jgi:hypothetical protein
MGATNKSKGPKKEKIKSEIRVFAPCEYIVQDKRNRFSLINIYDRIFTPEIPKNFLYRMLLSISAPIGSHNVKVTAENPEKDLIEIINVSQNIGEDGLFSLVIEGILEFKYYGIHYFNAYVDDDLIGRTYVNVAKPVEKTGA